MEEFLNSIYHSIVNSKRFRGKITELESFIQNVLQIKNKSTQYDVIKNLIKKVLEPLLALSSTNTELIYDVYDFVVLFFAFLEKDVNEAYCMVFSTIFSANKNIYSGSMEIYKKFFEYYKCQGHFQSLLTKINENDSISYAILVSVVNTIIEISKYCDVEIDEIIQVFIKATMVFLQNKSRETIGQSFYSVFYRFFEEFKMKINCVDIIEGTFQVVELMLSSGIFERVLSSLQIVNYLTTNQNYLPSIIGFMIQFKIHNLLLLTDLNDHYLDLIGHIIFRVGKQLPYIKDDISIVWKKEQYLSASSVSRFYAMFTRIVVGIHEDLLIHSIELFLKPSQFSCEWLNSLKVLASAINNSSKKVDVISKITSALNEINKSSIPKKDISDTIQSISLLSKDQDSVTQQVKSIVEKNEFSIDDFEILESILDFVVIFDEILIKKIHSSALFAYDSQNLQIDNLLITLYTKQSVVVGIDELKVYFKKIAENHESRILQVLIEQNLVSESQIYQALVVARDLEYMNVHLYKFIKSVLFPKHKFEVLSKLPFEKEDLLWALSLRKSKSRIRFAHLLCRILSRNDQDSLSDNEVVIHFFEKWNYYFESNTTDSLVFFSGIIVIFVKKFESFVDLDSYNISRYRFYIPKNRVDLVVSYNGEDCYYQADRFSLVGSNIVRIANYFSLSPNIICLSGKGYSQLNYIYQLSHYLDEGESSIELKVEPCEPQSIQNRDYFPSIYVQTNDIFWTLFGLIDIHKDFLKTLNDLPVNVQLIDDLSNLKLESIPQYFNVKYPNMYVYCLGLLSYCISTDASIRNQLKESYLFEDIVRIGLDTKKRRCIRSIIVFLHNLQLDNTTIRIDIVSEFLVFIPQFMVKNEYKDIESIINCCMSVSSQFIVNPQLVSLIDDILWSTHVPSELRKTFSLFLGQFSIKSSVFASSYQRSEYLPPSEFFYAWSLHFDINDSKFKSIPLVYLDDLSNWGIIHMLTQLNKNGLLDKSQNQNILNRICRTCLSIDSTVPNSDFFAASLMYLKYVENSEFIFKFLKALIGCNIRMKKWDIQGENLPSRNPNGVGLDNLGCTCFVNSIFQQMFHIPMIYKAIIEYNGDNSFTKEFQQLFASMKLANINSLSPRSLLSKYDEGEFEFGIQQDACEFFTLLIDRLENIIGNNVSEMIAGSMTHIIQSIDKKHSTSKSEHFKVLPLMVEGSESLEQSISRLSDPEYLADGNGYIFDGMKTKTDAIMNCQIDKLPDILIIQLKRFQYDVNTWRRYKINNHFEFPENLSLLEKQYRIQGIVIHEGSADYGHYYSYIKNGDVWIEFNDSKVLTVESSDVFEKSFGKDRTSAYLLIYSSVNHIIDDEMPIKLSNYTEEFNNYLNLSRIVYRKEFINYNEFLLDSNIIELSCYPVFYYLKYAGYSYHVDSMCKLSSNIIKVLNEYPDMCEFVIDNLNIKLFCPLIETPNKRIRVMTKQILTVLSPFDAEGSILELIAATSENWVDYSEKTDQMFEFLYDSIHKNSSYVEFIKIFGINEMIEKFIIEISESDTIPNLSTCFNVLSKIEISSGSFVHQLLDKNRLPTLNQNGTTIDSIALFFSSFEKTEILKENITDLSLSEDIPFWRSLLDLIE